jgi:hypothetical protein
VADYANRHLGTLERQIEAAEDLASRMGVVVEES